MSIEFNEFLNSFSWASFIAAASNNILMLAALHWFPWSFHRGNPLSRYEAFVSGCASIAFSFGLWVMLEADLFTWLALVLCIVLLHWPLWFATFMYKISHVKAYTVASLPVLLVFIAWAISPSINSGHSAGNYNAILCVAGLYATGGIATATFYYLDRIGMNEHITRNDK